MKVNIVKREQKADQLNLTNEELLNQCNNYFWGLQTNGGRYHFARVHDRVSFVRPTAGTANDIWTQKLIRAGLTIEAKRTLLNGVVHHTTFNRSNFLFAFDSEEELIGWLLRGAD